MRFRLEGMEIDAHVDGFVSTRSAHGHLFKHVVPLYEHAQKADMEMWHEVIPDPPLERAYERRVRRYRKLLAESGACPMTRNSSVESCQECSDGPAQRRVEEKVQDLLEAWYGEATRTVRWALENRTSAGEPRARVSADGDQLIFLTVDPRMVKVVAVVDRRRRNLRLLTCYRCKAGEKKKNYEQVWLDLCREAAGARHAGTERNIEKISEGV